MRKGDLVRAYGFVQLYPDNDAMLLPDGRTDVQHARDNDLMIFLGKGRFTYIRVLHPEHGTRRVDRAHVRLVTQ